MAQATRFDNRTTTCTHEPTLLQWGRDRIVAIATANGLNPDAYLQSDMDKIYGYLPLFDQLVPIRDVLPSLWQLPSRDDSRAITVVNTHISMGVLLPVYRLEVPDVGVFYMRNNFYGCGVSCSLEFRVPSDLWGDLFDPTEDGSCFEGFSPLWRYAPFIADSRQQFSLMLSQRFESLYTFMFILRLHAVKLGLAKPHVYS